MKILILLNVLVIVLAGVLPNEFLMWHSYALYGVQAVTMIPYLSRKAALVKNLFLPTFFVLVYFLVNLTFGSYLVPREYGWNKEFTAIALNIEHYNVLVPYFLLSNMVLFLLSSSALSKLARLDRPEVSHRVWDQRISDAAGLMRVGFFFGAFFLISYLDVYTAFSFQLALLIVHFTDPSLRRRSIRYLAYAFYLGVLVAFDYDNKREIVMSLFLMVFLEAYDARMPLKFSPRNIAGYVVFATLFFALILAASILRGYGDFQVASLVGALQYIPQYITSDVFMDGITDNLELNYSYGVAITSIDHMLRGLIDYQYGASLIKVFFLPISRDVITFKPESTMQIFTRVYSPEAWANDGSLPVMFASEMFMNLHYLGLLPFMLVWICINKLFLEFHVAHVRSFMAWSCVFLFVTILMFARGSGIEQWLLYYLVAAPALLLAKVIGNSLRLSAGATSKWVV